LAGVFTRPSTFGTPGIGATSTAGFVKVPLGETITTAAFPGFSVPSDGGAFPETSTLIPAPANCSSMLANSADAG
jgi:hypothetical protein